MSEEPETERNEAAPLQNWKLKLAYDGTDFHGWQVQPGQLTVQGELQRALGRITGEAPLPQGSGRTDAGVHALAQVASFELRTSIPAEKLRFALNRILPPSIRVLEARTVPSTFHARHSVVAKTYEYRVFVEKSGTGGICPPTLARYVLAYPWPLNLDAMKSAAAQFVGEHNFRSFAATDPDLSSRNQPLNPEGDDELAEPAALSTVRKVFASDWEQRESEAGTLLFYRVRGSGFLHHMVRNLVGTMLDVGRGRFTPSCIKAMLAAQSRAASGPTAPARGLFLSSVEYVGADL
jgi:tRNA pseudouridine38-40 synthase